jgi:hypothetical protein
MNNKKTKIAIMPVTKLNEKQISHVSGGKVYACGNVSNPSCQTLVVSVPSVTDVPKSLTIIL